KPYDIQMEFMQRLFETIEKREFAIFESPTGTGKSLSIICGALTWLQHDSERKVRMAPTASDTTKMVGSNDDDDDDKPDWIVAHEKKMRLEKAAAETDSDGAQRQKYLRWVVSTRRREAAERKNRMVGRRAAPMASKAVESNKRKSGDNDSDDERMVVEPYFSESEASGGRAGDDNDDGQVQYSAAVRKLLDRRAGNRPLYDSSSDDDDDNSAVPPEEPSRTKIIYASRTHSQIQQFIGEIKRTQFGAGNSKVKCVTLGSRTQLCINGRARRGTTSVHAISERCLEMQQTKSTRCEHLPPQHTPMLDFKDAAAATIMDIEELAKEGQRLCTCPYYGARAAVNGSQVVALPYNTLLSRSAREAMGICLRGNVVIVDEAHNLFDTILSIHSVSLDWRTVQALLKMTQMYFTKYWRRLNASNTNHIRQTIALLKALDKFMRATSARNDAVRAVQVNDFLTLAHADHINVYKIDRYLRKSKLGRKLNMFADQLEQNSTVAANAPSAKRTVIATNKHDTKTGMVPATAVAMFEAFMECLGKPDRSGSRLVIRTMPSTKSSDSGDDTQVELKYLLLDPSEAFGDICAEARAVILAGGTMKPANDIIDQLLPRHRMHGTDISAGSSSVAEAEPKLDPANAQQYAWNHVVDPSRICSLVVGSGPNGTALRFAHNDQSDAAKLREAGLALAALCQVIPGGVVAFFPSYKLLGHMYNNWRVTGIVGGIEERKPVFVETPSASEPAVDVLTQYSEQVRKAGSTGALLLSVVGGRLSEGINFSDDLGRAVVMVGVPFPSLASPELTERLAYYDAMSGAQSVTTGVANTNIMGPRAKTLYESLCMRAVNQSIGRAIRHCNDYAAIVFLDARYAESRIANKLPAWIAGKGPLNRTASDFDSALTQISSFFKRDFA
ncbi:ATP-dependent DNA helicase chl1, partial [Coemansia sp. BCRC 34301]